MTPETRKIQESAINDLIRDYRQGLKLALEGKGAEVEAYLSRLTSMRSLVRSLVYANKLTPEGKISIYKILDRLRCGILSNNSAEKYDSKTGIVSSEDFQRELEESLV